MTIFNLKIQLLIGLLRIWSRVQKSVLTGLLLPDPKLLHKGRHTIISQTYTQHIPLRCARFAHQEGLLDTECICECCECPAKFVACVCVSGKLSVCSSDPRRFPLQDMQRSSWIDGQLKPDRDREQETVQDADAF